MGTPAPAETASQRSDVFISYSRKDREFVKRLEEELQRRGRETWVDWQGIRPAEEFLQAIFPAIEGTDTFIFVLSPDSVTSETCGRELAHAVSHNKRMIPIMARDVDAKAVPEPLAKLNWVFARETDSFDEATNTLISALDTDLGWVRAHTRLLTRAIEWEANARSNSFVLRGEDLRSAEQWLAQAGTEKERQPTRLQTEYIIASRKAAARRQRITLGAVGLGAVVAVVLAVIAWLARNRAEDERRNAEAATKRATLARDKAGELIVFMSFDLRDKLQPINRLDLLADVNRKVRAFYESFAEEDESSEMMRQRGVLFNNQGNVAKAQGDLAGALQNYRDAAAFFEPLSKREPGKVIWQRNHSIALWGVAEVLREQGDLTGALHNHRAALAITERLYAQDANKGDWEHDLAIGYRGLGDVQRELGDLTGAQKSYRDSFDLAARVLEANPEDTECQNDLSAAHERIGYVRRAQGDVAGALESYRLSQALTQKLAQREPANPRWQGDLSVLFLKVGEMQTERRDFSGALQSYREGLAIAEKLSQQDPANVDWQRHLSIGYNLTGDLLNGQGDTAGALESYRKSLAIREKLADGDANNYSWQSDLALTQDSLGKVLSQRGDSSGALALYRQSLAIRHRLTERAPANIRWRTNLARSYLSVASEQAEQGDAASAFENFRASLSIAEPLAHSGDIDAQETLSVIHKSLGGLYAKQDELASALQSYRQALDLLQSLSERNPNNASWQSDLAMACALAGTTQRLVEPGSEKEGRALVEKARDILMRLKSGVGLTAQQEPLLKLIEENLQTTRPVELQEANTDRKVGNKRRKGR